MKSEIIKKWVSARLSSWDYRKFILADLFYRGYIPDFDISSLDMNWGDISLDKCKKLTYNYLRRNSKKKMNYLLSRPYTVLGNDDVKDYLLNDKSVLKETVLQLYQKGEVWWEFEPCTDCRLGFRITVRKAESIVPHYIDEEETMYDAVGYLWNHIDDEGKIERYIDVVDSTGRYRLSLSAVNTDLEEVKNLGHAIKNEKPVVFSSLPFIRLTSDSIYELIDQMSVMYSDRYKQADELLTDNADPVAVIKNASGTDDQVLMDDIRCNKMVKVDGTGDFTYASKSFEYSSIENFMKVLKSDIADISGVVSREQELNYVTSGRAIDRLYIDMDNDAAEMGDILRSSIKSFLGFVSKNKSRNYLENFDIIFNTDKPTDETQIIQNISSSSGMLSKETLLAQHPWVDDVKKEMKRLEKENLPAEKEVVEEGVSQVDEEEVEE